MQYVLIVKKVDVPEDASFTRRVKVSVKADPRFEYDLDENEYVYTIPVQEGQEVRVDYKHENEANQSTVFRAGNSGKDFENYSILLEKEVSTVPPVPDPEGFVMPERDELEVYDPSPETDTE